MFIVCGHIDEWDLSDRYSLSSLIAGDVRVFVVTEADCPTKFQRVKSANGSMCSQTVAGLVACKKDKEPNPSLIDEQR